MNCNGNLLEKLDKNGVMTYNTYDGLNRLTNVSAAPAGEMKTPLLDYDYAETGAMTKAVSYDDAVYPGQSLETDYAYDAYGRLVKQDGNTKEP